MAASMPLWDGREDHLSVTGSLGRKGPFSSSASGITRSNAGRNLSLSAREEKNNVGMGAKGRGGGEGKKRV